MASSLTDLPSWLAKFLEVLELGTPGAYAATTYAICHWADSNASDEAKTMFSNLLQPKQYDKRGVGSAVICMFDEVYTRNLVSWNAFARSTLFTICMTIIFLYESFPGKDSSMLYAMLAPDSDVERGATYSLAASLFTNIISDYVSLFAVRRLLVLGRDRPLFALWMGALVGMTIVAVFNLVISNSALALVFLWQAHGSHGSLTNYLNLLYAILVGTFAIPEWRALLAAAFVVHLWLPLLSVCVGILRAANYFRRAVGWTQWFLKEGRQRPLDAIGCVAALIVFTGAIIAKGAEWGASRWLRIPSQGIGGH
jgi:hypothetical protein